MPKRLTPKPQRYLSFPMLSPAEQEQAKREREAQETPFRQEIPGVLSLRRDTTDTETPDA